MGKKNHISIFGVMVGFKTSFQVEMKTSENKFEGSHEGTCISLAERS